MTNIVDVVLDHRHAHKTNTPGKACVDFWVNASFFEYIWMDHATAKQFYPAFATHMTSLFVTKWTANSKFKRRFSERKVKRLSLYLYITLVVSFHEFLKGRHQVTNVYTLTHINTF